MSKLVYLLSDFGHADTSVGEMHAVIISIDSSLVPVDLTHEIEPFNVKQGAYMLESRLGNLKAPYATIAVVDPGVGSERRGLAIKTYEKGYLVGPDNGLLLPAAERYRIMEIRAITNPDFFNPDYRGVLPDKEEPRQRAKSSDIFHGRDIFAASAAYIEKLNFYNIGNELRLDDLVCAPYAPARKEGNLYVGEVPFIDEYGNVFTNILLEDLFRPELLPELKIEIYDSKGKVKNDIVLHFGRNFTCVEEGDPLVCDDSYGYLHLCRNMGSFSEKYKVEVGDRILVR